MIKIKNKKDYEVVTDYYEGIFCSKKRWKI